MEHYSPIMKKYCHLLDGAREYHTKSVRERQISYHLHMESKRIIHIILYTKQIDP